MLLKATAGQGIVGPYVGMSYPGALADADVADADVVEADMLAAAETMACKCGAAV
jgi:hypothetical protein